MKRSRGEEILAQLRRKVRELPPGGDLEGLIEEEYAKLRAVLYEESLEQRQEQAASSPEAFSPSELPALRRSGNAEGTGQKKP
jgi:hypothetical protein